MGRFGEGETERQGDGETGRQGDWKKGEQGGLVILFIGKFCLYSTYN